MTVARVGTRGSALALRQTRHVCELLSRVHGGLTFREDIITTYGDDSSERPFGPTWPAGAFVGAIEHALLEGTIDLAVHSYKDLPTVPTPGLVVAAVPKREAAHDLLVTREPVILDAVPERMRIGTSSPRRRAQLERWTPAVVVPIRGNVTTRLGKVESGRVDGVVLAAAGLIRLGIKPSYVIELPVPKFVPAPGQGALAVQVREGSPWLEAVGAVDDGPSRLAVEAERSFLQEVAAGCHVPAAAHATVKGRHISLRGQLFDDQGAYMVDGVESGSDPVNVGRHLGCRLRGALEAGR